MAIKPSKISPANSASPPAPVTKSDCRAFLRETGLS
ncbi:Uncharacterised protein [Vibrio cholerae]|nr:Uncharacterised protein [Vibrio cholerae]